MNRIKAVIIGAIIFMIIPLVITAATIWSGSEVYHPDRNGILWEVKETDIQKVTNPGAVYSISDLSNYSAYMSNRTEFIGAPIEHSFYWYNKSRLGYVKLIKVKPGQDISFLFSAEKYVYCAEYDSGFRLLRDGSWLTTGDKFTLNAETEWIIMVFRNATGDLSAGAGNDDVIRASDIQNLKHKYLILEPFKYTFNLNGGVYNGSTDYFTMERLGVTKMTLPVPKRDGYNFKGWRAKDGRLYDTVIPVEYNQVLFSHTSLDAEWTKIAPSSLVLSKTDVVLEANSEESVRLTASILPSNTLDNTVVWTSSNPNVATVDTDGTVRPQNPGQAVITATTVNGISASCTIYVMGFQVRLPEYCSLEECYEIKVDVFHNGTEQSEGRKHIILNTDEAVELVRVGDVDTTCKVLAETSVEYGGNYNKVEECIVDTMESVSVYYRLKPAESLHKNGDYEGNVTFSVSVK